jgi:2-polyprenyl-6-hydroxyphenyl methylase/3-demethylubiquinone-9 3-methyltransferase
MEVIEHVVNPQEFMNLISASVKDNGLVLLSTIRRSISTWFTHILLAERLTGLVPRGTHHHSQFINPEQCQKMMSNSGIDTLEI